MKNFKLGFAILLALLLTNLAFAQSKLFGKVVEVIDGRTIVVEPQLKVKITIRLQYLEVPEVEQQLHSVVSDHLKKMVLGKTVAFETIGMQDDRSIGRVFLGKVDLSQQMLRDGAAWYSIGEKDGHATFERNLYETNEAQAKAEKRGVWSIASLKPAWEFRANKEEELRQAEIARLRKLQDQDRKRSRTKNLRPTAEQREQANANVKIWADVENSGVIDANALSSEISSNSIFSGYDTAKGRGYVSTVPVMVNVKTKDDNQKILLQLMYIYKEGVKGSQKSVYLFSVLSISAEAKFAKAKTLTVYADKKALLLKHSERVVRRTENGVEEILFFRIKEKSLAMIKKATKLRIRVGGYSGKVEGNIKSKINDLLETIT